MTIVRGAIAALLLSTVASPALGDNWPRFRGPNGSATTLNANLPTQWSPGNVLWKAPLPGHGVSSPCIWGDHLFVTAARNGGKERLLLCFDAKTGRERWQRAFSFQTHPKHAKNSYATSTPATDGKLVFTAFADEQRHIVAAHRFDGAQVWERDLGPFGSQHASGASPIVDKGRVFMTNEQDGPSSIFRLDAATGAVRWKTPQATLRTAYSTPFLLSSPAGEQLICSSMAGVTSFDPETGKELWRCHVFDKRAVGSPVLAAGLVIATSGEGGSGTKFIAVDPQSRTIDKPVYELTKEIPYCPTPLAAADRLFFVTDMGIARCLKAKDGAAVWTKRLGGKFAASPVRADENLFFAAEDGDVFVVAAADEYRLLARNHLDDRFLSTPAIADHRLYLRGEQFLWCIGDK